MPSPVQGLIEAWNSLGIVKGFFEFLKRRIDEIRGSGAERQVASISEVGEAFADGWLELGDLVVLSGRVSRFAPVYFPVAYSPQIIGMVSGGDVISMSQIVPNPAPALTELQHVEGAVLAFLFPIEADGTPRITSPVHLDRLGYVGHPQPMPYSSAAPSIPVLLDQAQLKHLEQKVQVVARVRSLPKEIRTELENSSETFVKLYYHGFYQSAWFPDQGFLLDARTNHGGRVKPTGDPSPFCVNVAVEVGFDSLIGREEFEDVLNVALDELELPEDESGMRGIRTNYRPAYHIPGGYEILQVNRLPVVSHLAFEKRALQVSLVADATSDIRHVGAVIGSAGRSIREELVRRDPRAELTPLFASDQSLFRRMGLKNPTETTDGTSPN